MGNTSSVKRYEHDGDTMRSDSSGNFVDYDDYETLLDKYSDLQEKYEWIVKGLVISIRMLDEHYLAHRHRNNGRTLHNVR
jgi:hypothetical protein